MTTSIAALNARVTTLSDSKKHVQQLIQRLAKLTFQPGSTPLHTEEGDVRIELSSEIHESLKALEEELELLRQEVEEVVAPPGASTTHRRRDSERDREKSRLSIQVARLGEDLKIARSQFRKAQLTAKKNAEAAKQKERELLFSSIQSGQTTPTTPTLPPKRRTNQNLTQDEIIAGASSDVTVALRRTHQLMQAELSRSNFAQETLDQSTRALQELSESYTDLDTLLSNSKSLLSTLVSSQKSDTWYLETAFYILICTIAWLAFRRWFYGPLWWLIWFPLRLTYRLILSPVFSAVGLTAGAATTSAVSVATSVAASSSKTTSLIVHPSATSGPPKFKNNERPYIRVGSGGHGAKVAPEDFDPSRPGSLSQQVGQMVEQQQQQQQREEGPILRGDGQPLVDSDRPRNPKKRMWDEDVEAKKREEEEKQAQQQQEAGQGQPVEAEKPHGGRVKRDEL